MGEPIGSPSFEGPKCLKSVGFLDGDRPLNSSSGFDLFQVGTGEGVSRINRQFDRECSRAGIVGVALGLLFSASASARIVAQPADLVPEVFVATPVQRGGMSLQQAIALAQQRYQGRVVRAETKSQNGRRVHEIRILGDDGRVRTVRFNADGGGR